MFLAQLTSLSKPARVVYVVDTPIDYTLAETLAVQNNALCVLASQLVATLATLSKPIKCVFLARNSQHHVFQALAESVHAQVSAFEWADYSEKEIEVALVRTAIPQVKSASHHIRVGWSGFVVSASRVGGHVQSIER
jgi:NAD(P)H-dependent flavin oxidoreductase YrpB (nitropropane dioxygenase family)